MADFAEGLPNKGKVSPFPSLSKQKVRMNIQTHDAVRAGKHYDLRFQDPEKPIAYSWAIPKTRMPKDGEKLLAVRQPDHRSSYMGWSGVLETGYGKGKVTSDYLGPVDVQESTAGKVRFKHDGDEYLLHRTKSEKNWLIRKVAEDAAWSGFFDEFEKIGKIDPNVSGLQEGTPITNNFREIEKALKPGDIILTKPSSGRENAISRAAKAVAKLHGTNSDWVHSGIYEGNKRQVHSQYGFDYKKRINLGPETLKVRRQSLKTLPSRRDVLVVRPNGSKEEKQEAIQRIKSLKDLPYSRKDVVRAALAPKVKGPDDDKVPDSLQCHGATGWAYQKIMDFRPGKSPRHILAHHIAKHPSVQHVIAYSGDKK